MTWYQCSACHKMWFREIGFPDSSCPECNGLKASTFMAGSVIVALPCASCANTWRFRTTIVFEKMADAIIAIADTRRNYE